MNSMLSIKEIKVRLNFGSKVIPVGRLALREYKIYFEYDSKFIDKNLEISPLQLPLQLGVVSFTRELFEGLPGVFNDSLPDGWGRLLLDRFIRSQGISPSSISVLDRLAFVGANGLGAFVYEPEHSSKEVKTSVNLENLARQVQEVLDGSSEEVLQELLSLNGSSAGARPKALIGIDENKKNIIHGVKKLPKEYSAWMVKFQNSQDSVDAGAIEYIYSLMAKRAGVFIPDTYLFSADKGAGYFAIQRFDREQSKEGEERRFHMHTACGLLHSDFRVPSLDYKDLLELTRVLTRDVQEVEKMYRLAVFNVLAHNRDDHSKNFSFLMNENGEWKISPAYDLTFSSGPNGEQSTMVMGEGKNPTIEHLIKLGIESKINKIQINKIIEQTKSALAKWPELAKEYGVSTSNRKLIEDKIKKNR